MPAPAFVEAQVGAVTDGSGGLTLPSIAGGTDVFYAVCLSARLNQDVSSFTGGGLGWNEVIQQQGFRAQTDQFLYWAFGSPSSFALSITTDTAQAIAAIIASYSGSDGSANNIRVANFDSEADGPGEDLLPFNGATESTAPSIDVTPGAAGQTIITCVNVRNRTITAKDADYEERGTVSSDTIVRGYLHDRVNAPSGTDTCLHTINANADWVMAALVIKESGAGPAIPDLVPIHSRRLHFTPSV